MIPKMHYLKFKHSQKHKNENWNKVESDTAFKTS